MSYERIGENIYSASAEGGRIYAIASVISSSFIGIILLIIGYSLLTKGIYYNKTKTGIVKSCNCQNGCNTVVGYCKTPNCTINKTVLDSITTETDIIGLVSFSNTGTYNPGQKVNLYYNENDLFDLQLTSDDWRITGLVLVIIAILITGGSWLRLWMANKSKFLASTGGLREASTILR